jgi:hypothetical protein
VDYPPFQLVTYFGFNNGTNVGACSPSLLHYMTKLKQGERNKKHKPPSFNFGDLLHCFNAFFSATLLY